MAHWSAVGRLKEQDELIGLIRQFIMKPVDGLLTMTTEEAFASVERLINDHVDSPDGSRLSKFCRGVKAVHLKLELTRALREYDARTQLLKRRFVPPTFKEVRHIMNIASIHAAAPHLNMVTLDADDTIYEDGGVVDMGSPMINIIIRLLRAGVTVALVTAAGYPGQPHKYEQRLRGLLDAFQLAMELGAPPDMTNRFLVMGGECNYLHRISSSSGSVRLETIPDVEWKDGRGVRWMKDDITELLDTAERCLLDNAKTLALDVTIIRKERAVGMVRTSPGRFRYEVLEEVALSVQDSLKHLNVPFCAFNGGKDVWVDVGNKCLGIRALQAFVGEATTPATTVHVGDRFTPTGNDVRARDVCTTLWVSNPEETQFVMRLLLRDLAQARGEAAAAATLTSAAAASAPAPAGVAASSLPPAPVAATATAAAAGAPGGGGSGAAPPRVPSPGLCAAVAAAAASGSGLPPGISLSPSRSFVAPASPRRMSVPAPTVSRSESVPGKLKYLTAREAREAVMTTRAQWEASGGEVVGHVVGDRGPSPRPRPRPPSVGAEDEDSESELEHAFAEM